MRGGLEGHLRFRDRITLPSIGDVEEMARREGIPLDEGEAEQLHNTITALVMAARQAERRTQIELDVLEADRRAGGRPTRDEDPLNAFVRRCDVRAKVDGPLSGLTVAVKDNIAIAGIPMTEGALLPAFTPSNDAVVVERVLAAGGRITGTLTMDEFGGGATGVMSANGPARNPVDPSRAAGGSSGGAGAAVASGAVDLALAVDQGGSSRIPAAYCGLVAIKATHGLVPSYGVGHIDHTIDYVTPVARSVEEAARLLQVIAGPDWRDPQWVRGPVAVDDYLAGVAEDVRGLRIGVVDESMRAVELEPTVQQGVERAEEALRRSGADVQGVSIPLWRDGFATYQPYVAHLIAATVRSEGVGTGHLGYVDVDRMYAFAVARRAAARTLNPYLKSWMLADRFLHERHLRVSFGVLQNQRLALREAVTHAFADFDVLLTPTLPGVAPLLPDKEATIDDLLTHTPVDVAFNTSPLNLTGHPAASVPSHSPGTGVLPTAVQLIGAHFDERAVIRAASALERALADL